jgi:hypothetical protein
MGNSKKLRYKGLSEGGNFILCQKTKKNIPLDEEKRTKLWISSEFLFIESLEKNPEKTKKILIDLIKWNTLQENYEACNKLLFFLKMC